MLNNDIQTQWKELENKNVFLYIDFSKDKIRISENNERKENEVPFAIHSIKYNKREINEIGYALRLVNIEFPDGKLIKMKPIFSNRSYEEQLNMYDNFHLKRYIFLIKRTMKVKFFSDLKKEEALVLAKFDGIKLKIFHCEMKNGEKTEMFIPAFSDTDEFEYFKKTTEYKLVDSTYSLLVIKVKDIVKNLEKKEGIYFNPNSYPVSHKDFSLALSNNFLRKY